MAAQSHNELQVLFKGLSYFRTHWYVFLIEMGIVAAATGYLYAYAPVVYQSATNLLIDATKKSNYQATAPMMQMGATQNSKKINTTFMLMSQDVLTRLQEKISAFYTREGKADHMRYFFAKGKVIGIRELKRMITVSWDRNSDIYGIRCSAPSPIAARDLCVIYLSTIQVYYPEIGLRDSTFKHEFLQKQIQSLVHDIGEKEKYLTTFESEKSDFINLMVTDAEDKPLVKLGNEFDSLRREMTINRATKILLSKFPTSKKGELTERSKSIDAITDRIAELRFQRDLTDQSRSAQRARRMQTLETEIQILAKQLSHLNDEDIATYSKLPLASSDVRDKIAGLEFDYRIELIRMQSLQKQISETKAKELRFQPDRLVYERIQSDLVQSRKLLSNLYVSLQETDLELAAGGAEVYRLFDPSAQAFRVSPQLSRYVFGGISVDIFLCFLTAMILMALFPRLDSEAEVNRMSLPVLGKVPHMPISENPEEMPSLGFEYLKDHELPNLA